MMYLLSIPILIVGIALLWITGLGTEVAVWVYAKDNPKLSKAFRKWEDRMLLSAMAILGVALLYILHKWYEHIMQVFVKGF